MWFHWSGIGPVLISNVAVTRTGRRRGNYFPMRRLGLSGLFRQSSSTDIPWKLQSRPFSISGVPPSKLNHRLLPLLKSLEFICASEHISLSDSLRNTIQELNRIDSGATAFRYPPKYQRDSAFDLTTFVEDIEDTLDELWEVLNELKTIEMKADVGE